jgi:hypothetical protein
VEDREISETTAQQLAKVKRQERERPDPPDKWDAADWSLSIFGEINGQPIKEYCRERNIDPPTPQNTTPVNRASPAAKESLDGTEL